MNHRCLFCGKPRPDSGVRHPFSGRRFAFCSQGCKESFEYERRVLKAEKAGQPMEVKP